MIILVISQSFVRKTAYFRYRQKCNFVRFGVKRATKPISASPGPSRHPRHPHTPYTPPAPHHHTTPIRPSDGLTAADLHTLHAIPQSRHTPSIRPLKALTADGLHALRPMPPSRRNQLFIGLTAGRGLRISEVGTLILGDRHWSTESSATPFPVSRPIRPSNGLTAAEQHTMRAVPPSRHTPPTLTSLTHGHRP